MSQFNRHTDAAVTPIICTWLFQDTAGEESYYPQVGRNSSASEFLEVYIRAVACFFSTSARYNPEVRRKLFTNLDDFPPLQNGWSLADFLASLGVDVVHLPLSFATPEGYYGAWRNQFYVFDILDYLAFSEKDIGPYLILDSDCVIVRDLSPLFDHIRSAGALVYDLQSCPEESINGLTTGDMRGIFQELAPGKRFDDATYYGGEFIAVTREAARDVSNGFRELWPVLMERHRNGKPVLTEEAHCLSYLYTSLPAIEDASQYIKRIWSGLPHHPTNILRTDMDLSIWHVPSEKRYGLARLFYKVVDPSSAFWSLDPGDDLNRFLGKYLGIPQRTPMKFIQDVADGIVYKFKTRHLTI